MMSFSYYDLKLFILVFFNYRVLMIMYWVVYFLFINGEILLGFILVYVFDVGFFKFCYIFLLY